MAIKTVEIWADSFHEGVWCCDNICSYLRPRGYICTLSFANGFIPMYQVFESGNQIAEFYVYGSYKTWIPMPQTIKDLIEWGKPDFIAYDHLHKSNISRTLCQHLYKALSVAWTIRSQEQLDASRKQFDLFIFEGFIPKE